VCDGFETQGQRVAVLGRDAHAAREAAFVAGFDNQVTWLSLGSHANCDANQLDRLRALGVAIVGDPPRHIDCGRHGVEVEMDNGARLAFDVLYPALGLEHASGLATALGARANGAGQLVVTDHFETTVPGLFAAGDVASGLNQINVAAGEAAIAATAIHNRLP
jgi:thioredoxin reductase (NADPH)